MRAKDIQAVKKLVNTRITKLEKELLTKILGLNKNIAKVIDKIDLDKKLVQKDIDKKVSVSTLDFTKQLNQHKSEVGADVNDIDEKVTKSAVDMTKKLSQNKSLTEAKTRELTKNFGAAQKTADAEHARLSSRLDSKIKGIQEIITNHQSSSKEEDDKLEQAVMRLSRTLSRLNENLKKTRTDHNDNLEKHRNQHLTAIGRIDNDMGNMRKIVDQTAGEMETVFLRHLDKATKELKVEIDAGLERQDSITKASNQEAHDQISAVHGMLAEAENDWNSLLQQSNHKSQTRHEHLTNSIREAKSGTHKELKEQTKAFESFKDYATQTYSKNNEMQKGMDDVKGLLNEKTAELHNAQGDIKSLLNNKTVELQKVQTETKNLFNKKTAELHKAQEHIKSSYATIDQLNTGLKNLQESFNTDSIKLSIALDQIRESYTKKELAYSLRNKTEDQIKERDKKINEVLKKLQKITNDQEKKLNELTEELDVITTEHNQGQETVKTQLNDYSEIIDNKQVEINEWVTAENTKLNQMFIRDLESHKREYDKTLKELRLFNHSHVTGHVKQLSNRIDSVEKQIHESIKKVRTEHKADIDKMGLSLTRTAGKLQADASVSDKKLIDKIETLRKSFKEYSDKNDAENTTMWDELVKSIDTASSNAERSINTMSKETIGKVNTELKQFKDILQRQLTEHANRNSKLLSGIEKEYKESAAQFKQSIAQLDKSMKEYRETNETDKKTNYTKLNSDIDLVQKQISHMLRFEDSLAILNSERKQLMSMLESYTQIKREINKEEDEKLNKFNEYVREKAKEFNDVVTRAAEIDMHKKVQATRKKKKTKPKTALQKHKSPAEEAEDKVLKKISRTSNVNDQVKILKQDGMSDKEIIDFYQTEFGDYKSQRARRALKIMKG